MQTSNLRTAVCETCKKDFSFEPIIISGKEYFSERRTPREEPIFAQLSQKRLETPIDHDFQMFSSKR